MSKEIAFWKIQIKEHMMFIFLGLSDELMELKEKAIKLHESWHNLKVNTTNVMPLIDETLKFQYLILKNMTKGVWIGWLSMSFMNHLIKETQYFKDKLSGKVTYQDEIKFWLWHHHSECAAAEKLLDPTEEELSLVLKDYIEYVKSLEKDLKNNKMTKEIKNVLKEYIDNTTQLEEGILNNTIYSNISPLLIKHVIREGYYAIELFKI